MKKIKIIDLLNKIANGEVPKKIKYDDMIWEYDGDYYSSKNNIILEEYCNLTTSLNDEVEIIEEDNKIEKLNIIQEKNCKNNWKWKCNGYNISTPQKIMGNKINEIIDKVNKLGE